MPIRWTAEELAEMAEADAEIDDAMDYGIKITLKAARVNAGYSQREAAEQLGISREALQSYECGKTIPNWEVVMKIKDLYKLPLDVIAFGTKTA